MKNNVIFDFERYGATGIYLFLIFVVSTTFFTVLLREAKQQNTNWTAPAWTASVVTLFLMLFAGSLIFKTIEVSTGFYIPKGIWNFIPVAILGWITSVVLHWIAKKIAPVKLKVVALKIFS